MLRPCISVNGQISNPEDAQVPVLDRGFLYGDSVYEVLWWHHDAPVQLDEHLARLERSAARLYMQLQPTREALIEAMRAITRAAGVTAQDEAYVRLVVTRGAGPLGLAMDQPPTQNLIVILAPAKRPDPADPAWGLRVRVVARQRIAREALDPSAKTGNYMNNALALHEARRSGADDALLLNAAGHVTEATTANVYGLRDGVLFTPALASGLLEGTTRRRVLALCKTLGIEARERVVQPDDLRGADEVFLSSSVRGLAPVHELDDAPIGSGTTGPLTQRIRSAFEAAADADAVAWHAARTPSSK